ncbi:hypothetical protein SDC9_111066 [bioreactor metagenome]|uniref:Uncharacterized protein n=1 Tax=bioreactor metagenome TaxID=1076179 RepID=A0A645BFF5_9ZZZZ
MFIFEAFIPIKFVLSFIVVLISLIASLIFLIAFIALFNLSFLSFKRAEYFSAASFNSSISLFLPKRFWLLLMCPPVTEPPALITSPASVTIFNEFPRRLEILNPLSRLSTTRILPSRNLITLSNSGFVFTSKSAVLITLLSLRTSCSFADNPLS